MSEQADTRQRLARALVKLARELPPSTLSALTSTLRVAGKNPDLARIAATPGMKGKLRSLQEAQMEHAEIDGSALAFALQAVSHAIETDEAENHVEIAWTGTATEAVPLRRVDQVIYDMVESAADEVLLVTYAAYKAERALKALLEATKRNVRVKLVIELAAASGGKISFDALQEIRSAVPLAEVYYWPLDRRKHNASGAYGSMHTKCIIADRSRAIVSSANLTDYALEMNMELGLVVGRSIALKLAKHFDQLIAQGDLIIAP